MRELLIGFGSGFVVGAIAALSLALYIIKNQTGATANDAEDQARKDRQANAREIEAQRQETHAKIDQANDEQLDDMLNGRVLDPKDK